MGKILIGVMGPGSDAKREDVEAAYEIGKLIASEGWILLSGGRNVGVMDSVNKGAKEANGLTVGILPTENTEGMSSAVDIPIVTGLGQARNNINVLSSKIVISCGIGAGTVSEIALAIKARKKVILLQCDLEGQSFFKRLGGDNLFIAKNPYEAIQIAKEIIKNY